MQEGQLDDEFKKMIAEKKLRPCPACKHMTFKVRFCCWSLCESVCLTALCFVVMFAAVDLPLSVTSCVSCVVSCWVVFAVLRVCCDLFAVVICEAFHVLFLDQTPFCSRACNWCCF